MCDVVRVIEIGFLSVSMGAWAILLVGALVGMVRIQRWEARRFARYDREMAGETTCTN